MSVTAALLLAGCGSEGPGVAVPPAGARFDYQLGGGYPPAGDVDVVVRDRTVPPDPDRYSICYVNAFQTQPGTQEVPEHLLLHDGAGARVEDPDWPGEHLLDVSTDEKRTQVLDLVGSWFDGCADAGYRAVEPDNLDSWTRSQGLLDQTDAREMARLLVDRAHAAGLSIAQKNTVDLAGEDLGFDFAVTEDCQALDECQPYAAAFAVVLDVEYEDAAFAEACSAAPPQVSVVRRDLLLVPAGEEGHVARWCPR